MVEGIASVKQMTFVYLLGYQMKFKKSRLVSLLNFEVNFFIFFSSVTLKKHYIIKATRPVI